MASRGGLTDPVEVPARVLHLPNPIPVLPRPRKRIARNLSTDLDPVMSDQHTPQTSLIGHHELREGTRVAGFRDHGAILAHTQ